MKTYEQLLIVRTFLGVVEAVFFPGAVYYLSAWYTKQELGKRLAGLYIAQQVGNAFGGLLAAGILQLDGAHGESIPEKYSTSVLEFTATSMSLQT